MGSGEDRGTELLTTDFPRAIRPWRRLQILFAPQTHFKHLTTSSCIRQGILLFRTSFLIREQMIRDSHRHHACVIAKPAHYLFLCGASEESSSLNQQVVSLMA
jgi:hypothetical protein